MPDIELRTRGASGGQTPLGAYDSGTNLVQPNNHAETQAQDQAQDTTEQENETTTDPRTSERPVPALAPQDAGWGAWSFLVAATVIETIVWGLPYSVGILHAYWSSTLFPGQESTTTLAATLQNGLLCVFCGIMGPLFAAWPQYTRHFQIAGLVFGTASLVCAAFVTQPWHLVLTIGIMYPLSEALHFPCVTMLFGWFNARRGLATGILFSGAAAGGTFFPLLGTALLHRVGYKGTMLSLAAIFGAINLVAFVFVRPRVPIARVATRRPIQSVDYAFLRRRALWAMGAFVGLTSIGNFIPSLWMPIFADVVGPTRPSGTALVAIMYAASVLGNLMTGGLSDRLPVNRVMLASCVLSALAATLLWGFGTHDALLILFSLAWGLTALCTPSAWSKMISLIAKDDPTLPGLLFGIDATLRGVGNFASGPVSTALLKTSVLRGAAGVYGSTNYGVLLLFTGLTTLVGGLAAALFPVT